MLAELLTEQGRGSWLSGRFAVDTSWQLEWRHDSHRLFTLDLVPAGADVYGQSVVNVAGPSRGLQPMYEPGQYRIRIRSAGSWSVRVVDLDHAPHLLLPAEVSGTAPTNTPVFEPDGAWLVEWQADELELQLATADLTRSWSLTTGPSSNSCATSTTGGTLFIHVVSNQPWAIAIHPRAGEMVCPVG